MVEVNFLIFQSLHLSFLRASLSNVGVVSSGGLTMTNCYVANNIANLASSTNGTGGGN